ncbi:hypothetical protein HG530_013686 [Fusarium avenaceum]|nr:hypothetical protein HG530_013686 [Fusarium avenaceum]
MSDDLHNRPIKEHTMWTCNKNNGLGGICGHINTIDDWYCEKCGSRRGANTSALDDNHQTIGTLTKVDHDGTEYWRYDGPSRST